MSKPNDSELITLVADLLLTNHIEVFHHHNQATWIKSKPNSKFSVIEAELFSRQAISWLTFAIFTLINCLISERQAVRICHFIEGSPANQPVQFGSTVSLSRIVDDPIIATFLVWSEKVMSFPYQSGFQDWFSELRRFSKGPNFPRSPSALSRKIKPLMASLEALGFVVSITRNSNGVQVLVQTTNDDRCLHSSPQDLEEGLKKQALANDDDDAVLKQLSKS